MLVQQTTVGNVVARAYWRKIGTVVRHPQVTGVSVADFTLRESLPKPPGTSGELVELRSIAAARATNQVSVLVKTQDVEIVQLLIPAGSSIPTYEAAGEIIVHCLQGRVRMRALEETRELRDGQLVYLSINEAFSIEGLEDASVLATIISAKHGENIELIGDVSPQ